MIAQTNPENLYKKTTIRPQIGDKSYKKTTIILPENERQIRPLLDKLSTYLVLKRRQIPLQ